MSESKDTLILICMTQANKKDKENVRTHFIATVTYLEHVNLSWPHGTNNTNKYLVSFGVFSYYLIIYL